MNPSILRSRSGLLILLALLLISLRLAPATPEAAGERQAADSLGLIPRPVIGLEDGALRWGAELTVTRIFLPLDAISPWLEAGIRYFERLATHPDDKKIFLLRSGLFVPLANGVHLAPSLGLVSGGGEAAPELGLSLWRFFGTAARPRPKLADYGDYGQWLEADRTWERARNSETTTALGFGIFISPGIAPAAVLSLAIAVFL